MSKKLYLPLAMLIVFSMLLGACSPAAEPTQEVVTTEPPPTEEVVATEEPVALDIPTLLVGFWVTIPADQGFGAVNASALNTELAETAPFLVDVREASELESGGFIEGAVNIPIRDLLNNLDKLPGLDEPIVIYCGSGHRGALGMVALKMLGYTNVRNLNGGVGAWTKAGLSLVTGSMPAAPAAISTPIVEDEALFTTLNDYLTNLPEGFYTVKADALATELADNPPILVDTRRQSEWDNGYIKDAILVDFGTFMDNLDKLPADKDANIVVYCGGGHRGAISMMAMQLLGYTNVRNLNGGFSAWKSAGLPIAGEVDWPTVMGEFVAALPADQGYYSTSAAALNELLAAGTPPFLVDVRENSELEASGYITGAIHIPIRTLLQNLDKLPALDQKIVIYCGSGHRGALGMVALRLLGYTDVVNLGGGTGAWTKAGFTLDAGLPAEAAAGTAPSVNPIRLRDLDAYLSNLPEGFGGTKPAYVNELIVAGTPPAILDVRSQAEVEADGYIEGSLLIPITDLPANLDQLPTDKAAPVVATCKSGHRGAIAMMYLNFLGYTDVKNLGGGIGAWIAAELPVVK